MPQQFLSIIHKGGPVMWPLLVLSLVSVTLSFERALYWFRQNGPAAKRGFAALMEAFRRGDRARVAALAETSDTVYARVARALLEDGASDAVAVGSVETERIRMDRFMASLSTIVTAAPMLGILGTVTGIITSFELLSGGQAMVDPRTVSGGISEALVATASGLIVALISLFPFMGFGALRENTLGRLETMIAVAQLAFGTSPPPRVKPSTDPTRAVERPPLEVGVQ
jgi:biopolymer transport protein ExbB